jgi:hypothetical protein
MLYSDWALKGGRFLLREAFTRKLSTAEAADCSTQLFFNYGLR